MRAATLPASEFGLFGPKAAMEWWKEHAVHSSPDRAAYAAHAADLARAQQQVSGRTR